MEDSPDGINNPPVITCHQHRDCYGTQSSLFWLMTLDYIRRSSQSLSEHVFNPTGGLTTLLVRKSWCGNWFCRRWTLYQSGWWTVPMCFFYRILYNWTSSVTQIKISTSILDIVFIRLGLVVWNREGVCCRIKKKIKCIEFIEKIVKQSDFLFYREHFYVQKISRIIPERK